MIAKLKRLFTRKVVLQSVFVIVFWSVLFNSVSLAFTLYAAVLIHELGHAISFIRFGIPLKKLSFNLIGAYVEIDVDQYKRRDYFCSILAGPAIGSLFGVGALLLFFLFRTSELLTAAKIGLFLNLLNLIPVFPLDGGRILLTLTSVGGRKLIIGQLVITIVILIVWLFLVPNNTDRIWLAMGIFVNAFFLISQVRGKSKKAIEEYYLDDFSFEPVLFASIYACCLASLGVISLYVQNLNM